MFDSIQGEAKQDSANDWRWKGKPMTQRKVLNLSHILLCEESTGKSNAESGEIWLGPDEQEGRDCTGKTKEIETV